MMRVVFAILLVLELFGALAYAMPKGLLKGKKGEPQPSGSSATSTTTETKDETSTPVFLPSHWVNTPYENCNAEQTEMINNWIMDAYNMTYEADRITNDNPAFKRYFFRRDFSQFKDTIQSFNSRAGLGDGGKYNLKCAEYEPDSPDSLCHTQTQWAVTTRAANTVYFCPLMFDSLFSKVPYSSKPFDNSPNGWCQTRLLHPHPSHVYVHEMAHLGLHTKDLGYPVLDYRDPTMSPKQAAYNLKRKHMQSIARKPPTPHSLLPTLQNAESYAATIVDVASAIYGRDGT
ncbi:hypothetical protein GGU10DRAFT_437831 [Lentinula aff. detonsa]|uniref:Lysine-specific metallo-endopeptidase domain-containing protein n=1 Tax=Lentinula aff. detonsa TaxID=2804958 RepID=A0AA38NNB8_9AGAR|nr:hypothetical protein GGU10DRAFT_437831 [Lentinula aff. detonsa]